MVHRPPASRSAGPVSVAAATLVDDQPDQADAVPNRCAERGSRERPQRRRAVMGVAVADTMKPASADGVFDFRPGAQIPLQGSAGQTAATFAIASAAYRDDPAEKIEDANS